MATPNSMGLDLPTVSSTLGPEWASLLNAALEIIDAHDHSTGKGTKVTPAGININAALTMASNALQLAASVSLANKVSADSSEIRSIQSIGNDLYYINSAGTAVRLTNGSSIVNTGGLISINSPSSYPYTVTSADLANMILADSSGGAVTINLPAASGGELYFWVKDETGSAQTNNISIAPDGSDEIENVNANYVIDWNNGAVALISDGATKWHVF